MKDIHGLNWLADGIGVIMTAVQTNEVYQTISFIITLISILFSICYTCLKLISWFKDAKADGHISKEEVEEAKKIIEEQTKVIEDAKKHLDDK